MDRFPSATSLSRALLALRRAEATGVLTVRSERREATLAIVMGIPRAAACPVEGEMLGDLLCRNGHLDEAVHAKALGIAAPVGPRPEPKASSTR